LSSERNCEIPVGSAIPMAKIGTRPYPAPPLKMEMLHGVLFWSNEGENHYSLTWRYVCHLSWECECAKLLKEAYS